MYAGFLSFNEIPEIGFAHTHYGKNYTYTYTNKNRSFEIAYIHSGGFTCELYGKKMEIKEGCLFILFRDLPVKIVSDGIENESHCTVQVEVQYYFKLIEDVSKSVDNNGVVLPFVVEPGETAERVKKILHSIVADKYNFTAPLKLLTAIQMIDEHVRKKLKVNTASSVLDKDIKDYIEENSNKYITLAELASAVGKTPNYLNSVFKRINGITINKYINNQKIRQICRCLQRNNIKFPDACKEVGINDVSYGYRLFKKHMGITPAQFVEEEKFIRL